MRRSVVSFNSILLLVCASIVGAASSGCCNGCLCSHRFAEPMADGYVDGGCSSCGSGGCGGGCHGGLGRGAAASDLVEQQQPIKPACSLYHPVPTAPVFAPKYSYQSPTPLNVQKVPAHAYSGVVDQPAPATAHLRPRAPITSSPIPPTSNLQPTTSRPALLRPTPATARPPAVESSVSDEMPLNRPQNARVYSDTETADARPTPAASAKLVSVQVR